MYNKESEKKQKQQERESKKAEQARKKEELARKKEQAKKKDQRKKGADKVCEYSSQKRKTPCNPAKTYPIRKRAKNDDTSIPLKFAMIFAVYAEGATRMI